MYEDDISKVGLEKLDERHASLRMRVPNCEDVHDTYERFHPEKCDVKPLRVSTHRPTALRPHLLGETAGSHRL